MQCTDMELRRLVRGEVLPPASNTGVNSGEPRGRGVVAGLGWLQGSFPSRSLSVVMEKVGSLFGPGVAGRSRFFRGASVEYPGGVLVAFDEGDLESRGVVAFPAVALEGLGLEVQRRLVGWLGLVDFRCTRLDVSMDDYERSVLPLDVFAEGRGRGNVVGFHADKARLVIGEVGFKGRSGDTAYFGRRGSNGSGRCVRVYEKSVESEGRYDCVRWEVEFADECAAAALLVLQRCPGDRAFVGAIAALVGGAIDFRDRGGGDGHGATSSLPRVGWWERLVERFGGCFKVVARREPTSLAGKVRWIFHSVVPSLKACGIYYHMLNGVRIGGCWRDVLRAHVDLCELAKRDVLALRHLAMQRGLPCPV